MLITITVPRLGWTMEEGTFVGWLKQDGEAVREGEPLFTLDGDKALQEIEASDSGILRIPPEAPKPGSVVRAGDLLGYLVAEGEELKSKPAPAQVRQSSGPFVDAAPVDAVTTPQQPADEISALPSSAPERAVSPGARRAASLLGIDAAQLQGTGSGGRARERDVLAASRSRPQEFTRPKASFSLQDKIAIVTGAASGIGAAIADAFAEAGAIVYVADINESGVAEKVKQIEKSGGRARLALTNVAEQASCEALIRRVLSECGSCDILANNAGVGHVGTILTTPPEELARLWSVNVQGMYFLSRAVLPSMIERRRGSIINMASTLGLTAMEDRFAYTITKHAVVGLTRSMALDFGPTGVRINCICPGRVETPFVQARLREYPDPEKFRAQMVATHAQKRMAQPWEIAAAAVYLASDESAFMTGSTFVIDGGYLCGK